MDKPKLIFLLLTIVLIILRLAAFNLYVHDFGRDAILTADSEGYLDLAYSLIEKGSFARVNKSGVLAPELFCVPGYPLFLAVLIGIFKLNLIQVVYCQIVLTVLTAFIVYKMMGLINPKLRYYGALFMLCDFSVSHHSMYIMTETLFMFVLACFIYQFMVYIDSKRMGDLVIAALLAVMSAFVRPVGYYLPYLIIICYFLSFYKESPKRVVKHTLIFLSIVFSLISLWQLRNFIHLGVWRFSSIGDVSYGGDGLVHSYTRFGLSSTGLSPIIFYCWNFLNLIARVLTHATVIIFNSDLYTEIYGFLSTAWVYLWIWGVVMAMTLLSKNIYLRFLLVVMAYLIAAPVFAANKGAGERFRIPIYPYIALMTTIGWNQVMVVLKSFRLRKFHTINKNDSMKKIDYGLVISTCFLAFYAFTKLGYVLINVSYSGEYYLIAKSLVLIFCIWFLSKCLYQGDTWAWWVCLLGSFIFSFFSITNYIVQKSLGILKVAPYPAWNHLILILLPVLLFLVFVTLLFSKVSRK